MTKFLLGVIVGITLATVGLSGVAHIVDSGVARVQEVAKEASK